MNRAERKGKRQTEGYGEKIGEGGEHQRKTRVNQCEKKELSMKGEAKEKERKTWKKHYSYR